MSKSIVFRTSSQEYLRRTQYQSAGHLINAENIPRNRLSSGEYQSVSLLIQCFLPNYYPSTSSQCTKLHIIIYSKCIIYSRRKIIFTTILCIAIVFIQIDYITILGRTLSYSSLSENLCRIYDMNKVGFKVDLSMVIKYIKRTSSVSLLLSSLYILQYNLLMNSSYIAKRLGLLQQII